MLDLQTIIVFDEEEARAVGRNKIAEATDVKPTGLTN